MKNAAVIFLFHIPKTAGTSLRQALSEALGLNDGFVHLGPYGDKIGRKKHLKPLQERSKAELSRIQVVTGHYLLSAFEKYFPDREIKRAVLLRDPAERLLSQYNHAMRNRGKLGDKPVDFHVWYQNLKKTEFDWQSLHGRELTLEDKRFAIASVGDNYMSKFLLESTGTRDHQSLGDEELYTAVTAVLNTFWHVGSLEKLPASIDALESVIGKKLDVGVHNKSGGELARHLEMNASLAEYIRQHNHVDYRIFNSWCG